MGPRGGVMGTMEGLGWGYKRHKHEVPCVWPLLEEPRWPPARLTAGSKGGGAYLSYLPLFPFLLLSISFLSLTSLFVVEFRI